MPVSNTISCLTKKQGCYGSRENSIDGITTECVCPKCGVSHRMKLLWSGRGRPKKFCPPCKTFVSTLESLDYCGIPADIHKGLE